MLYAHYIRRDVPGGNFSPINIVSHTSRPGICFIGPGYDPESYPRVLRGRFIPGDFSWIIVLRPVIRSEDHTFGHVFSTKKPEVLKRYKGSWWSSTTDFEFLIAVLCTFFRQEPFTAYRLDIKLLFQFKILDIRFSELFIETTVYFVSRIK